MSSTTVIWLFPLGIGKASVAALADSDRGFIE
jgi:hypothetical protein